MSTVFEHGYAIIIGVDDNNIKRLALPSVAKDVTAVHEVLVHPERCAYNPDNVKLISGIDSTSENILSALSWLQEKVKADADATAVIYYSGHGMVDKKTDQYYLIPYDIRTLSKVRYDAIQADEFNSEISAIQSDRLLVILDCCHAAGMDVKDVDLDAIDEDKNIEKTAFPLDSSSAKNIPTYEAEPGAKAVSDLVDGVGRAILNSSTGSQSSYIRKDGKMSLFTYHFIEALTGHAPHADDATVVYVTDVMSWVTHEVKKSAAKENRQQTPVMRTSGVFPVAQLIGGQGLSKGIDGTPAAAPPDPLAPLPSIQAGGSVYTGDITAGGDVAGGDINKHEGDVYHGNVDKSTTTNTTSFNMGNQTIEGEQINAAGDVNIGHMGDKVEMGTGDYVKGDKNIHGDVVQGDKFTGDKVMGNKVEGDQISVGNISGSSGIAIGRGATSTVDNSTHTTTTSGDTFNMSGDFRGSNVNIKSTLENVTQSINTLPYADDSAKADLVSLVAQLDTLLKQIPAAEGQKLSAETETLLQMAANDNPNPTVLEMLGNGLKQTASKFKDNLPEIAEVATKIVTAVISTSISG